MKPRDMEEEGEARDTRFETSVCVGRGNEFCVAISRTGVRGESGTCAVCSIEEEAGPSTTKGDPTYISKEIPN